MEKVYIYNKHKFEMERIHVLSFLHIYTNIIKYTKTSKNYFLFYCGSTSNIFWIPYIHFLNFAEFQNSDQSYNFD